MVIKCSICLGKLQKTEYRSYFNNLEVYKCLNCKTYCFNPKLNLKEQFKKFYSNTYWIKFGKIKKTKRAIKIINKIYSLRDKNSRSFLLFLKPHLKKTKNILEIGPGKGALSKLLYKKGHNIDLLEPDKNNSKKLNKQLKKSKIYNSFFDEKFTCKKKYDIIILNHVLEHFEDLNKSVTKLHSLLNKKGIVIIEVPNAKNKEMLLHSINEHPHTYHFSKKGLKILFRKNNFSVKYVNTEINKDKIKTNSIILKSLFIPYKLTVFGLLGINIRRKKKDGPFIKFIAEKK